MEVPEGSKVEILGGRIHLTAAPIAEHVGIASETTEQFYEQLPRSMRSTTAGAAIAPCVTGGDFAVPDLIVAPKEVFDTGNQVLPAVEMHLVAEVVPPSNATKDLHVLPEVYAFGESPCTCWSTPARAISRPTPSLPTAFTRRNRVTTSVTASNSRCRKGSSF
ncbi:hypothetical protein [Streptomonospora halophila]|uniref:hypothetical protein n=1 Tax=Streptomonospora halophila TaxID=427369 RepID=UPI0031E9361A